MKDKPGKDASNACHKFAVAATGVFAGFLACLRHL
jgi:hypothetical protein